MMGSRIMHYCIANLLSQQLDVQNHSEFLLGGVAPDVHPFMQTHALKPKDITHYVDRDVKGKGRINVERFYHIYKERIREPFYLGYLCHLISDSVWSGNNPLFDNFDFLSAERKKELLQVCYRDFGRLNGRIIRQYSLKLNQHSVPEHSLMDEFPLEDYLQHLLEALNKDFSFDEQTVREPLEFFHNDNSQIIEFIDKSVQDCMQFLRVHQF